MTKIQFAKIPSKELLKKWAKMTDENEHAAVRIEIAHYFGDSINPSNYRGYDGAIGFEECFKDIQKIRTEYYEDNILSVSNLLTHYMLIRIESVYGDEVMEAVSKCL